MSNKEKTEDKFPVRSSHMLLIVLVAFLLFLGSTQGYVPSEFLSPNSEIHVFMGDTVKVPFVYENTYGYFTNDKPTQFSIEFYSTVPDGVNKDGTEWPRDNSQISSGTLANNGTLTGQVISKIPDVPGVYTMKFDGSLRLNNSWVSAGHKVVKINVVERPESGNQTNQNQTNNGNVTVEPNGDGTNTITIPVEVENTLTTVLIFVVVTIIAFGCYVYLKRKENKK